jgi:hypothetical protein
MFTVEMDPQRRRVVDVIRKPETAKNICTPNCPFQTRELTS